MIDDEEEDTKMSAEELKIHEDRDSSDDLDQAPEECKKTKKHKANIDQCAKILTEMFSTLPTEEKHKKLRVLIE